MEPENDETCGDGTRSRKACDAMLDEYKAIVDDYQAALRAIEFVTKPNGRGHYRRGAAWEVAEIVKKVKAAVGNKRQLT